MKQKSKQEIKQKPMTVIQKSKTAKHTPKPDDKIFFTKKDFIVIPGVFIITLSVYILTLAPTVYFGDSG